MKGLFRWIGFRQIEVQYDVAARSSGGGHLSAAKLFALGVDALIAFSAMPLRIWFYVGLVISVSAFLYGSIIIINILLFGRDVPGFATIITSILFFGGMQLLTLGIIGIYLERVFREVKCRPLYIVRDSWGFGNDD